MTSERAYVWTWLAGRDEPVVAGALDVVGDQLRFVYGRSYLARPDAVPLFLPELPLAPGGQLPPIGHDVHGCIADGAPDVWGRRVILRRLHGGDPRTADTAALPTLTYLLESGTDRIGANDFQPSADAHVPREVDGTLEEILHAADRLQAGEPFSPELDRVLDAGSSVGGARPKAVVRSSDGRSLIAKFSTPTDHYPVVRSEAVAMELARRLGIDVATTSMTQALGRDVLLVERFDREPGSRRRHAVVSALTLLGLHEMHARYATYPDLADVIRHRFVDPERTLHELFRRLVFNVLTGNRDDHARNHSAFWDGAGLRLTPAYDLCPQPRFTGEATQAMAITRDGRRQSRVQVCIDAAGVFLLTRNEACDEVDRQLSLIHGQWSDAADVVGLTPADRQQLWGYAIVHPYALEGYTPSPSR
jgi:serine/threonine-protein kinase HipA